MESRLLSHLLDPLTYPEETRDVTLVQTHISFLFVTDNHVYKIKKPLDLGFLNFTTLDRRRFYCEEEVRLNLRLCPGMYLGVVQIRESERGISFQGSGRIIEYAVKMRRLPADRMLDVLLQQDKVTGEDIRRIAAKIFRFHKSAERAVEIDRYGDISVIKNNWDENFRQVEAFVGITLDRTGLGLIEGWVYRYLADNEKVFSDRVAGGFIRDCDGDIHAENICMEDGIYIFDCIEFNERFRYIDTAADIAFLLMDLDYHGKSGLSDIFVNEYYRETGDSGMFAVLDFYKIYRAFVRGKVESFRLNDPGMTPEEKETAGRKARRHFRLARGYILRKKMAPALIIFTGLMGTGKSTLASELNFELGLELVSSDLVRKKIAGIEPAERDFSGYDTGIYSESYNRATYGQILKTAENALLSGNSIIIDASFRRKRDREMFRQLAHRHGVRLYFINTICADVLIRERLDKRILRGGEPSDGRWELFYRQKDEFEAITDDEGRYLVVDTSKSVDENINSILNLLEFL